MKLIYFFLGHISLAAMCPKKCQCPGQNGQNGPDTAFCLASTGFPDISRSPDLKDLYIGNNLEKLPPLADQLPNLRLLHLEDNLITSLSGSSLPLSLNDLTLDGNLLEKIDVGSLLADHPNLKRIYISKNRLSTLDGEFENLPQLIELKMSDNSLTKIPDLRKVPSLVLLHLANNLITSINGSILRLPNLTHLDLSGNAIKSVTRLRLPSLMELNLARNSLSSLDESLLNSRELGYLQIAQNPLEKVPAQLFQKLSKLKNLDASYTKLMEIPQIPDDMIVNELRLTGVSLNCDCNILWLTQYARDLGHVTLGLNELTCGTPARFSGIPVVDFNPLECKIDSDSSSEEDPCRSWECNYGAQCVIENNKPKCVCYDAWGGEHCEQLLIDTAKVTDLPTKIDEPTIWVDDVGPAFVEVSFARLSSTRATLKLWIAEEDVFVPFTSDVIDSDITKFRYEDLQPSSEYKLCISTNGPNSCAIFNTLPSSNEFLEIESTLESETNSPNTSDQKSSTTEFIGAAVAAAVLVVVVICVGVFMKRRQYTEKAQKSSYSGASGEECSTWRYAGAGGMNCPSTDRSTNNMTPESVPYSSYTGNTGGSENNYAEVCTNYHLSRTPHFAFEPALAQSTPQRTEPRSNRSEPQFYHYHPDEMSKTFHGNQNHNHHNQSRPLYTHHNNTNGYYCA